MLNNMLFYVTLYNMLSYVMLMLCYVITGCFVIVMLYNMLFYVTFYTMLFYVCYKTCYVYVCCYVI